MSRWVVCVARLTNTAKYMTLEQTVVGPFRTRERAERRRDVIQREADEYQAGEDEASAESPNGVEFSHVTLWVSVEPLIPGASSGRRSLSVLYGSEDP